MRTSPWIGNTLSAALLLLCLSACQQPAAQTSPADTSDTSAWKGPAAAEPTSLVEPAKTPADDVADPVNLLPNASFEQLDESGAPVGWRGYRPAVEDVRKTESPARAGFEIARIHPREGSNVLRFDNRKTKHYACVNMPVPLEPGRRYKYSGWVRHAEAGGRRGRNGPRIYVEFYDGKGNFLGGSYLQPPETAPDWQYIEGVTRPVPANAKNCHFGCGPKKGSVGEMFWDNLRLVPYRPELIAGLATDAYRDTVLGDRPPIRVRCGLNLKDNDLTPADITATLAVRDADGKIVATQQPSAIEASWAEFHLPVNDLPAGQYTLHIAAEARGGEITGEVTGSLARRDGDVPAVYIDRHQRLIRNGQAILPIGMFCRRWGPPSWEGMLGEFQDMDMNVMLCYDMLTAEELDDVHEAGLGAIYSLSSMFHPRSNLRKGQVRRIDSLETENPAVIAQVKACRDHPAVVAWYLQDERSIEGTWEQRLIDRYRAVRDADANHPAMALSMPKTPDMRAYLPTCDVYSVDPYPIPFMQPSKATVDTRRAVEGMLGFKPVWTAAQAFNHAAYPMLARGSKYRAPNPAELRAMTWGSLAAGANGIVYYSHHDLSYQHLKAKRWQKKYPGLEKDYQMHITREPREQRLKEIGAVVREVRRFESILLSPAPVDPPAVEASPHVGARWYVRHGKAFLLLTNGTDQPQSARWAAPAEATPTLRLGSSTPARSDDGTRLAVTLAPLEVLLIEWQQWNMNPLP